MHSDSVYGQIAAFAATEDAAQPAGAPVPPMTAATTRGYFAVEAPVLSRGLTEACRPSATRPVRPRSELSVTARALAAFAGHRPGSATPRPGAEPGDVGAGTRPEDSPTERLVHALNDELWFLGGAPAWIASGILVPLGADPDLAAALTEGLPLDERAALTIAVVADERDGTANAASPELAGTPGREGASEPPASAGMFAGLALLDGAHAPAWRAMLRSVAHRYEQADDRLLQWLAFLGDVSGQGGVDRLVFGGLALLSAVVDFADNGQEVLIASPAPATATVI